MITQDPVTSPLPTWNEQSYAESDTMISPVKVSVKTTIPAKSSGRLLDALTDVIRPLTEKMGLKADLIRLQREEVALKVATLAAQRVAIEQRPITPIPTKTVTRLLEAASLEEPGDDTMIRLWANLLASSALNARNNVPRYISILSDINGQQARLIQNIMTKRGKVKTKIDGELLLDDLWGMDQAGILLHLRQTVSKVTVPQIVRIIRGYVDVCGVATADIIINKGEEQWDSVKGLFPFDESRSDFEILESLSLIKDKTFKNVPFGDFEISVFFYQVTQLCVDMFSACNPDIITRRQETTTKPARRRVTREIKNSEQP